ncbi:MacB family efflux pump subunit [Corticimicrobacter populi]|uniref:Pyoverdine export ATP-binding/permease protein PvdT n=1 Tax=Corticimicrobacter populi TaxID=2175229 RepID=A0A2V1K2A5_9BURK|nr:MacB family efflux pump subunit [Corticimicrobacter populi]PWF23041.1 macrolide ABC transporter permease/ATP-binding protein MacB [Corticimicrobacter populi]
MTQALLELRSIGRDFPAGDTTISVLAEVDLDIHAGEMVAIVGASGSGKSTLMNILGCLDQPSRGHYRVQGKDVMTLQPDDLAELRREHFGFVFQRYHLLSDLDAMGNVEVPAVYAGRPTAQRHARSQQLLDRLGLAERLHYRPGQLSGGQQQRVSIARALINGGQVILADEPTGALDSQSGQEVMRILQDLNRDGHTIILVTHDMNVARHARRIIEISDGRIIGDHPNQAILSGNPETPADAPQPQAKADDTATASGTTHDHPQGLAAAWSTGGLERLREALRMALLAMNAHRLRTFLTMLGIIIGIASVVSVVALGEGSRQRILSDINAMGTNTMDIMSGRGFGDERSGRVQTLIPDDARAIAAAPWVDSVTPNVSTSASLRYRNVSATGTINGVNEQYFRVRGLELQQGVGLSADSVRRQSQDVIIDENTRKTLFGDQDPLGQIIMLGTIPGRIIGVVKAKPSMFGSSESLNVWIPYTTAMHRILGQSHLRSITVRVDDGTSMEDAEAALTQLLTRRHGTQDFFIINTDSIRQTIESTTATMTLLISSIALISLLVGGIGVMNIMLVSVTERTREIGVRMAVGARQSDILIQFLIEAVLVCLVGGLLGIGLALGLGPLLAKLSDGAFNMIYSTNSMVAAFLCSTLIGIAFGFLPARNAARLNPVDALARD